MATIAVKDASGATIYLLAASGAGTLGDPYIPSHVISDGGGSVTIDGTIVASGDVAHDAADSGNPQKVGARAVDLLTSITPVALGDRTDLVSDLDGGLIVRNEFPIGSRLSERVTDTSGASTAFTTFGATANVYNVVTAISIYNSSTNNSFLDIRDGTAGSVLATFAVPGLSGCVLSNIWIQGSVNTALAYDFGAAITTGYITIWGAKVELT